MKKIFITLLVCLICLSGCGKKTSETEVGNNGETTTNEKVEVDESLLTVTITLPNSFFETFDTTAEDYVNGLDNGDSFFNKVEMNDDGSVSITMTRAKYNEFMSQLEKSIDDSLQEMVDSDDYAINSVEHDKKFTEFKVELSTNEVGFVESFMVIAFAMYGGVYQLFDGANNAVVKVIYIGSDGTELMNWDSSQLADSAQ